MTNPRPNLSRRGPTAIDAGVILAAAAILYVLFGYWRFGWIGPAGFYTTGDELYTYEWITSASAGRLRSTLPFGQLYYFVTFVIAHAVRLVVPGALTLQNFTSTIRFSNAVLWVLFAGYCLRLGVRRHWLAVILLNPVVVFMAFGFAKPDFLCFALSVLALCHWIRFARHDDSVDLFAAAALLGAAFAAKASVVLTFPFYPLIWWSVRTPSRAVRPGRLALAAVVVALVAALGSPQYLFVQRTWLELTSESHISRGGFPGAIAYPGYYWLLILALSFPVETVLSFYELTDRARLRRAVLAVWVAVFGTFAWLVRHEMATHLMPLIAVLAAVGLDRESFGPRRSPRAVACLLAAAALFSAVCLYPRLLLNQRFDTRTSYGRAATFLRNGGIQATPLSETVIGSDAGLDVPAHLWRPDHLPAVLNPLSKPQPGFYLLARDTYIKTTVNAWRLGVLMQEYLNAYEYFLAHYSDRAVFLEEHELEADRRFHEIYVQGYWPWRYLLAVIRGEPVAPGSTVGVYRF